ncbi:MAG: ABC transporter permease [Myxococcota bacterium]
MYGILWRIAIRNTWRQKRRTVLSSTTIAFGIMLFIALDSLYAGLDRAAIDNMINLSASALKVSTRTYAQERESFPLKYGLEDVAGLQTELEKLPGVVGVTSRTRFLGELSNGMDSLPISGIVIDPTRDQQVFKLHEHLKGNYVDGSVPNQLILGATLAKELGLELGSSITLAALTRHESNNADEFVVAGLIDVTDPSLNRGTVFISYDTAQHFLELEGLVTELNVALERRINFSDYRDDMLALQQQLQQSHPTLQVDTFVELGASFLALSAQKQANGMVLLAVLLLIAAVGIFNTVMMSVYERVREIGVLRAHGMTPRDIMTLFMMEGTLVGVTGGVLGLLAGGVVVFWLTTQGLPLDQWGGDSLNTSNMPIWGTFYGEWRPSHMLFAFLFSMSVACIAGLIPARMAGKMTVTSALRFT